MPGLSALANIHLDDDNCMEVTALKDQAETCRSYYRRARRPLWPRGNDPNLG